MSLTVIMHYLYTIYCIVYTVSIYQMTSHYPTTGTQLVRPGKLSLEMREERWRDCVLRCWKSEIYCSFPLHMLDITAMGRY